MKKNSTKSFVFVLMPFSEEFSDIYEVGIKTACKDAGAYCEKVDEQDFNESILQRIYNQIAKAEIIVADMTGRNPNVFYETGYAHALNKQVILLTQNADDIPFDLKHYPHIIYGGKIATLKSKLERKIRWCIGNLKNSVNNRNSQQKLLSIAELPDELTREHLRSSTKIGLEGVSLFRFINLFHLDIEQSLKQGGELKVILVNPKSAAVQMLEHRSPSKTPVEVQRRRIEDTIDFLKRWAQRLPGQKIEVKLIDYLPPYGITLLEPKLENPVCYVRLFPFRSPSLKAPAIIPDPLNDRFWFEFFAKQFDKMWEAAEALDLHK